MRKIVIDPRVIRHLGRDLITSPEVAIIELIKNSIDAKASHTLTTIANSLKKVTLLSTVVLTDEARAEFPITMVPYRLSILSWHH